MLEWTAFSNLIWISPMGNFISVYLTTQFSTRGALKYKKREVNILGWHGTSLEETV
jgi:hypothetical protein